MKFVDYINSARVHYSWENWSTIAAKKKKEAENTLELKTWMCIQTDTIRVSQN